jgi:hypothetical protein
VYTDIPMLLSINPVRSHCIIALYLRALLRKRRPIKPRARHTVHAPPTQSFFFSRALSALTDCYLLLLLAHRIFRRSTTST